jgi:hypothetical protein
MLEAGKMRGPRRWNEERAPPPSFLQGGMLYLLQEFLFLSSREVSVIATTPSDLCSDSSDAAIPRGQFFFVQCALAVRLDKMLTPLLLRMLGGAPVALPGLVGINEAPSSFRPLDLFCGS